MAHIKQVIIDGIRGIDKTVDLGKRTIVTGNNGAGKSAIAVAIEFALLGLVPGYKKNETFANASKDTMRGVVSFEGHSVERTLSQGKKLEERITIDNGTPATPSASVPMLELILGKEPPVLNMPAFNACTSSETRRMVVKLVADPETQKRLQDEEKAARDDKNDKTSARRLTEKAIERLTTSLAELEKPVGNVDHLKKELEELNATIKETESKVATGEANERAKAQVNGQIKCIPHIKKTLDAAKKELPEHEANVALSEKTLESMMASKPDRVARVAQEFVPVIEECISNVSFALDDETLTEEVAESLCATNRNLKGMLPNKADEKAFNQILAGHNEGLKIAKDALIDSRKRVSACKNDISGLEANLRVVEEAKAQIDAIGEGSDQKDTAALAGLVKTRAELEAKIEPLREIAVLNREMEKARVDAEKSTQEEEAAKKVLEKAVQEQQKIVEAASEVLAKRSKDILPEGNLKLSDDGKDLRVFWARSKDLKVDRTTLSGSEQAIFDIALGHALAPKALLLLEAAEIDNVQILSVMDKMPDGDFQVVMFTCHKPEGDIPEGWSHIEMGK